MKGKKVAIVLLSVLILLAGVYIGGMVFFASHYTYGTVIGGRDCSFKKKNDLYSHFQEEPVSFVLELDGRDDRNLDIDSRAIVTGIEYDLSGLDRYDGNIIKGFGWIKSSLHKRIIDVPLHIDIDDRMFTDILKGSVMFDKAGLREPQNAYLGEYNSKTGQFEIEAGDKGNIISSDRTLNAVRKSLEAVLAGTDRITVDLDESDCYKHALMSVNNAKLIQQRDRANRILSTKITYDWYGNWDVIDSSVIKDWIKIEDNNASIDKEQVRSYIERSAGYYDTYGKELRFRTTGGQIKSIKRGNYGWYTDVDTEVDELVECLEQGGEIIKEPAHTHEGYAKGVDDIGNSYVEIDLSNQHLYLYVNGRCTLDTDFVSGNVSAGHKTPEGVYGVTYKTRNATLRGPGYESFVYYWMPYNGGVGMHDATWRSKFGGEIYKTSGSHGCINLPLAMAKDIYEHVETGFPVVSYW